MKRLFAALLIVLSFTACQKEVTDTLSGTEPGNLPGVSGSFTAKIDGTPWTADKGAYAHFSVAANGLPALISIFGVGNDKKLIGLTLMDSGVHQYTFLGPDAGLFNAGIFQDSSLPDVNSFASVGAPAQPSGTAIVQTIDRNKKTVSGTFSFTAYRNMDGQQRSITEGVFTNIPYTEGTDLTPAASKDTFTVKVDGTPFAPYSITSIITPLPGNSIVVQGSDQQGVKNVAVTFPTDVVPGTYTLDFFGATYVGAYNNGAVTLASISAGTLQILEHNTATKRVRGKFSFTGEDMLKTVTPVELTEGYFSVTYP